MGHTVNISLLKLYVDQHNTEIAIPHITGEENFINYSSDFKRRFNNKFMQPSNFFKASLQLNRFLSKSISRNH